MNPANAVFGARASVHLKYHNNISELASTLSYGLVIPDFEFSCSDWGEPVASSSGMGFELSLSESQKFPDYPFLLEIDSESSELEKAMGRMIDLSPWLARLIAKHCNIESVCLESDENAYCAKECERRIRCPLL